MAQLFNAGEVKSRPGVYYRYSSRDSSQVAGAVDGINAIAIKASWGPFETVKTFESAQAIEDTFGTGNGVNAAKKLFEGGASLVRVVRVNGTGGAAATVDATYATLTAKYQGTRALKLKVQVKPGDTTIKQAIVMEGTNALETLEFAVHATDESAAFTAAMDKSNYITVSGVATGLITVGEQTLTGGADPTVTAQNYLTAFQKFEQYIYSVLTTDVVDTDVAAVLKNYVVSAEESGKQIIGVVGGATATAFATRKANAAGYNEKRIVYFGSGWKLADGTTLDGALAINYVAGVISSTPSNKSIVHQTIGEAVDVVENLTNAQFEEAIASGMLLVSRGPDGQIWFDSGINTLITPALNEDAGWKKIKRLKIRQELFYRIDSVVSPLIGKANCDADGIATVIQMGMGIINAMIAERKILSGATMVVDPENPYVGDSAWFIIQVDDMDSLEKIYLHYQFRYSQNV